MNVGALLPDLNTKIKNYLQYHDGNNFVISAILKMTTAPFDDIVCARIDQYIDLYVTINSIFTICTTSDDALTGLKNFFNLREKVLHNDYLHYQNKQTIANQLCIEIARIAFPKESPMHVVLNKTETESQNTFQCNNNNAENDTKPYKNIFLQLSASNVFMKELKNNAENITYKHITEKVIPNMSKNQKYYAPAPVEDNYIDVSVKWLQPNILSELRMSEPSPAIANVPQQTVTYKPNNHFYTSSQNEKKYGKLSSLFHKLHNSINRKIDKAQHEDQQHLSNVYK